MLGVSLKADALSKLQDQQANPEVAA